MDVVFSLANGSATNYGASFGCAAHGLNTFYFRPPAAKPKTQFVDVPCQNGIVDLTESNGIIAYDNVTIDMEFGVTNRELFDYIGFVRAFSGKYVKMQLSNDTGKYRIGRLTVTEYDEKSYMPRLKLSLNADPFRYDNELTTIHPEFADNLFLTNYTNVTLDHITAQESDIVTWPVGNQKMIRVRGAAGTYAEWEFPFPHAGSSTTGCCFYCVPVNGTRGHFEVYYESKKVDNVFRTYDTDYFTVRFYCDEDVSGNGYIQFSYFKYFSWYYSVAANQYFENGDARSFVDEPIYAAANMNLLLNGRLYSLSAGQNSVPWAYLDSGWNVAAYMDGTYGKTCTVKYRRRWL